jgi:hypothetical protein
MGSDSLGAAPAMSGPPPFIRIALCGRNGETTAHALVSAEDADKVTAHRWYISGHGYAVRQISVGRKKQRTLSMARVILGLDFGDRRVVDHISADKLDNRRENIRIVTHAENLQNRVSRQYGSSRHRGVSFAKDRRARQWVAYGCVAGKMNYLGAYGSEDEAGEVAAAWRRENMPFATD